MLHGGDAALPGVGASGASGAWASCSAAYRRAFGAETASPQRAASRPRMKKGAPTHPGCSHLWRPKSALADLASSGGENRRVGVGVPPLHPLRRRLGDQVQNPPRWRPCREVRGVHRVSVAPGTCHRNRSRATCDDPCRYGRCGRGASSRGPARPALDPLCDAMALPQLPQLPQLLQVPARSWRASGFGIRDSAL